MEGGSFSDKFVNRRDIADMQVLCISVCTEGQNFYLLLNGEYYLAQAERTTQEIIPPHLFKLGFRTVKEIKAEVKGPENSHQQQRSRTIAQEL